jgi:ABC-type amino acid transport substrate-binding protein/tRNA A-37 threonylcarbamoyl transferase component Bud32
MEVGRYQLGPLLGRGAMAEVYEALDTRLGRPVAVKLLAPELAHDPAVRRRFLIEARAAAKLNHPGIVTVHDHDQVLRDGESIAFLVMELIEGQTLAQLLHEQGPQAPMVALSTVSAILAALAHAHSRRVVHRDVKPANVMLRTEGGLKVTDFGIARIGGTDANRLTTAGAVLGTVAYMAPDVIQGGEVGPHSDVYATGCLLYELLSGDVPYTAANGQAVLYRHIHAPVPSVSAGRPEVRATLDELVAKALAKRVEDRFTNAAEMLEAVRQTMSVLARQGETSTLAGITDSTAVPVLKALRRVKAAGPDGDVPAAPAPMRTTSGAVPPAATADTDRPDRPARKMLVQARARRAPLMASVAITIAVALIATLVLILLDEDSPSTGDSGLPTPTITSDNSPSTGGGALPTPIITARPVLYPVRTSVTVPGSDVFRAATERGRLVVGVGSDLPGLALKDGATGQCTGFDIEVAKIIAAYLGFAPDHIHFMSVDPPRRLNAIIQREVDYYVGLYAITDERKESVGIAGPYLLSGQGLLIRTDDQTITGFDTSMAGRKVCTLAGSSTSTTLSQDLPRSTVTTLPNYGQCVEALLKREVDAVSSDQAALQGYVTGRPGRLRIVGTPVTAVKYGIGLTKEDKPLRTAVNDALQDAFTHGHWKQGYQQTLGAMGLPAPPIPTLERY